MVLAAFLVILFLRWRNSEEQEPVKGILINGNGKSAIVDTKEIGQVADKKTNAGKKVQVIG